MFSNGEISELCTEACKNNCASQVNSSMVLGFTYCFSCCSLPIVLVSLMIDVSVCGDS